jgi:CBS domain-containing protein/sporulation protein YlmC with PRC-barrel domain
VTTQAATRVFLARLAGIGVFDTLGDQVGKVRDAIVVLRLGANSPRLTGLVVEVQPRRRIFVPMTKVTAIDAGQVIVSGAVNLRRFEQRRNENLVIGELLERSVTLVSTGQEVSVLDVAVDQTRSRDWLVSQLFVRRGGGGFRRGERFIVDWDDVRGLNLSATTQPAELLVASLDALPAADVATVLSELPTKRRMEVVRDLDDERLAEVLEEMAEDDRVQIVQLLEAERAADVLEEMEPDDAADLLSELPPEQAEALLERMEPEEAEDLRRLLRYDDYSAGGMMTPEPIVLPPDATVADALAQVRNEDLSPSLASQVYVTRAPMETPTGKYLGVCHFQRLLREPPATLVSAVLDPTLSPVRPEAPLAEVTRTFATYNLAALPVVDKDGRLLGAVTVDDVIDHMLPEGWRDRDRGSDG